MNLFKTCKYQSLEKKADKQVSQQMGSWSKDTLDYFFDSYPQLSNVNVRLVFKSKDEAKGYALGVIYVNNVMALPVIITNFVLSPLDIAITADGRFIPFSLETYSTILSNPSAFNRLKTMSEDEKLKLIFDRALISARGDIEPEKTSGFLEKVGSFVGITKLKQYLAKWIKEDEQVKLAFASNDNALRVIKRIGDIIDTEVVLPMIGKLATANVYLLTKIANSGYDWNLRVGSNECDNYIDVIVNEKEIEGLPLWKGASTTITTDKSIPISLKQKYFVNNENYYINDSGEYCKVAENIDSDISNYDEVLEKLATIPSANDLGYFELNGKMLTSPEVITKVAIFDNQFIVESAGHTYTLLKVGGEELWPKENNNFFVPGNARFIKLAKRINFDDIIHPKVTKAGLNSNYIYKISNNIFIPTGSILEKYGECNVQDILWYLLEHGGRNEDLEKVSFMKVGEKYQIKGDLFPKVNLVKISRFLEESKIDMEFKPTELIKLAAFTPLDSAVDAVLSLNFLNNKTLREYVEMIPMYEDVISQLARLVLIIRLGLKQIPEAAVVDSMNALVTVVNALRGFNLTRKVK